MAKLPEPGRVKMRLTPALSARQALAVHELFLRHSLMRLRKLKLGPIVLCFDPPDRRAEFEKFAAPRDGEALLPQEHGDLGVRIAAAAGMIRKTHPRMLFLSTDTPDVPARVFEHAVHLAERFCITLGPTENGSFWCIGFGDDMDPRRLLEKIPWGAGQETLGIIDRAAALGYGLAMADAWSDVDRPADLTDLMERLGKSPQQEDRTLLDELHKIVPKKLEHHGAHHG